MAALYPRLQVLDPLLQLLHRLLEGLHQLRHFGPRVVEVRTTSNRVLLILGGRRGLRVGGRARSEVVEMGGRNLDVAQLL
jgi:hypothetical protein